MVQKGFIQFEGPVVYAKTRQDIESVCQHLLDHVASHEKKLIIGFDMEWEFRPEEKPPGVVQLCLRVGGSGQPSLLQLTEPSTIQQPTQSSAAVSARQEDPSSQKRRKGDTTQAATEAPPQADLPQPESSSEFVCYVLHLALLGADRAPAAFKQLVEHPKVVLATVGDADERKLQDDFGISPPNLDQVNMMHALLLEEQSAQKAGSGSKKRKSPGSTPSTGHQVADLAPPQKESWPARKFYSLAELVGWYLQLRIDKRHQKSNEVWEKELAPAALSYAATDAYATLLVFEQIMQRWKALAGSKST